MLKEVFTVGITSSHSTNSFNHCGINGDKFLQATGYPACHPTNSVNALKAATDIQYYKYYSEYNNATQEVQNMPA